MKISRKLLSGLVTIQKVAKSMPQETLAEYVLRRRTELDLSQDRLAEKAGLSNAWVARLETGTLQGSPKRTTLQKLAKALNVSYEHLDRIARGLPIEAEEPLMDAELRRLIEVTYSLTPEDREEVLEYARMRLRRLQEKRKGSAD